MGKRETGEFLVPMAALMYLLIPQVFIEHANLDAGNMSEQIKCPEGVRA